MTHTYVPSLPPYNPPRHRRQVMPRTYDPESCARCPEAATVANCMRTFCPRHDAANYASHMARHATDSL